MNFRENMDEYFVDQLIDDNNNNNLYHLLKDTGINDMHSYNDLIPLEKNEQTMNRDIIEFKKVTREKDDRVALNHLINNNFDMDLSISQYYKEKNTEMEYEEDNLSSSSNDDKDDDDIVPYINTNMEDILESYQLNPYNDKVSYLQQNIYSKEHLSLSANDNDEYMYIRPVLFTICLLKKETYEKLDIKLKNNSKKTPFQLQSCKNCLPENFFSNYTNWSFKLISKMYLDKKKLICCIQVKVGIPKDNNNKTTNNNNRLSILDFFIEIGKFSPGDNLTTFGKICYKIKYLIDNKVTFHNCNNNNNNAFTIKEWLCIRNAYTYSYKWFYYKLNKSIHSLYSPQLGSWKDETSIDTNITSGGIIFSEMYCYYLNHMITYLINNNKHNNNYIDVDIKKQVVLILIKPSMLTFIEKELETAFPNGNVISILSNENNNKNLFKSLENSSVTILLLNVEMIDSMIDNKQINTFWLFNLFNRKQYNITTCIYYHIDMDHNVNTRVIIKTVETLFNSKCKPSVWWITKPMENLKQIYQLQPVFMTLWYHSILKSLNYQKLDWWKELCDNPNFYNPLTTAHPIKIWLYDFMYHMCITINKSNLDQLVPLPFNNDVKLNNNNGLSLLLTTNIKSQIIELNSWEAQESYKHLFNELQKDTMYNNNSRFSSQKENIFKHEKSKQLLQFCSFVLVDMQKNPTTSYNKKQKTMNNTYKENSLFVSIIQNLQQEYDDSVLQTVFSYIENNLLCKDMKCATCLENLHPTTKDVVSTICGHLYHKQCIDDWKQFRHDSVGEQNYSVQIQFNTNTQQYHEVLCPVCKSTIPNKYLPFNIHYLLRYYNDIIPNSRQLEEHKNSMIQIPIEYYTGLKDNIIVISHKQKALLHFLRPESIIITKEKKIDPKEKFIQAFLKRQQNSDHQEVVVQPQQQQQNIIIISSYIQTILEVRQFLQENKFEYVYCLNWTTNNDYNQYRKFEKNNNNISGGGEYNILLMLNQQLEIPIHIHINQFIFLDPPMYPTPIQEFIKPWYENNYNNNSSITVYLTEIENRIFSIEQKYQDKSEKHNNNNYNKKKRKTYSFTDINYIFQRTVQ